MPKITVHGGPSYEGHVDVTPSDVTEPHWVPAPVAEQPAPVEQPAPRPRRTRTRKA
jgi:hypothetical protein